VDRLFLGGRVEANAARLVEFLAHADVHEIPVDGQVAQVYAEILVALRRAGTPMPTNDIWIAACAARAGAAVLTFDAHFRQIRRAGSIVRSSPAGS